MPKEKAISTFTLRNRVVYTSGQNKLPSRSSNVSQLHQLWVWGTLCPNSPIFLPMSLQVWCPACPRSVQKSVLQAVWSAGRWWTGESSAYFCLLWGQVPQS